MATMFAAAPEPPTELGRYRVLSSSAGEGVSPLCLGAMSIGDAWSSVDTPCPFVCRCRSRRIEEQKPYDSNYHVAC
jgi:hypothetical protein